MVKRKLIVVKATFQISGPALIVEPGFSFDFFELLGRTHTRRVLVKRPDGDVVETEALFSVVLFHPRGEPWKSLKNERYVCMLRGLTKEDVPIGSEIFESSPNLP